MKKACLTAFAINMAIMGVATTPLLADDPSALKSAWREAPDGLCVEISQVSEPFTGPAGCTQIAGSMGNLGDLLIGYACQAGSQISFFSGMQSDNSIRPDIFTGQFDAEKLSLQYCFRISNDWPPEYNCEKERTFKKVSSCQP